MTAKAPDYSRDIAGLNDLVLLPNGKQIAVATEKAGIILLNFEDGARAGVISNVRAEKLCVSHDGRYLAANTGGEIVVYRLDICRVLSKLPMEARNAEMCFGGDGHFLWTQGTRDEICLWDVETGRRGWKAQASLMDVCGLACGPSGDFLLSASADHILSYWDLEWELKA